MKTFFRMSTDKSFQSWRSRYPYPQSHMRNLARKGAQTRHVFLTDVDVLPSFGAAQQISDFFLARAESGHECAKCAYVVPTYELAFNVSFPRDKAALLRLKDKGLARPFHQKIFKNGHHATNYSR